MADLRTAAQQALEALEFFGGTAICDADTKVADEGITALRAALAEPEPPIWQTLAEIGASAPAGTWDAAVEPEPVGWQWLDTGHFRKKIPADSTPAHWRPLYTAPPALQPLTTDQIVKLWNESIANGAVLGLSDTVLFARAVEHAHGIKEAK